MPDSHRVRGRVENSRILLSRRGESESSHFTEGKTQVKDE
jgi:hypothetical protein